MKQLYVHGLGQTSESWHKVIAHLHTQEFAVCPDLAKMVSKHEVTYQSLYAAFADICDAIDEPFTICGLSLGGVLALHYAIEHPEKVHSLILIATPYKMPKQLLRFQNAIFHLMPKRMFPSMGFEKADFLQLCHSMMDLDFSSSLTNITCPVLVIYGAKDHANKKTSITLAQTLKEAKILTIDDAGNEVNTEAPKQLADILCEFYQQT